MKSRDLITPSALADLRISLDAPPLERIRYHLDRAINDSLPYLEQYRHDFETRFCLWEGQSRDGRRWQENLGTGTKAKPWNGASDVRTFTADEIINERVETMMSGFRRAQFQVTALRSAHQDTAAKVNILLNWRTRNHLAAELSRELEKAAQWREAHGVSVLGIYWAQERRYNQRTISLQEFVDMAMQQLEQGNPQGAEALQQLVDPLMDEQTIARMQELSPVLDRKGAKKILTELRTKGETKIPQITIVKNQPCWKALRLFLDVFCPVETETFETARWTAQRCILSGEDLNEKVEQEGWDRDWAQQLWEQRGHCYSSLNDFRSLSMRTENGLGLARATNSASGICGPDQVEVWHHYYKGIEQSSSAPALMRLVWSPLVPDSYGHHDLFGYSHGQLPFVELARERVENAMADSRSVAEIATTHQNLIKKERDSQANYTDIATLPALLTPPWRGASPVDLSPGAQQVERKPGELRWFPPPSAGTSQSVSLEERTTAALAQYFGRPHGAVSPARTAIAQEHLIGSWLSQVAAAARMSLQLEQQYLDVATAERVIGDPTTVVQLNRDDIQGQFQVALVFDPASLDPERLKMKLEAFKDFVIGLDTLGVANRAKFVQIAARWIDPDLADQIVGTPQMASQREIDDEKTNLLKIVEGIEPTMAPEGQNYATRLQTLMGMLQQNPHLAQRIESQPDSLAIFEARIKHLSMMAEQYGPNREIGRVGARPGLETLAEKQATAQPSGAY